MQAPELSWLDRMKRSLNVDSVSQKLELSRDRIIEIAVFLSVGFLVGVLWKKCAQYIVAALIFIGIIAILQHLEVISVLIHWHSIQEICGLDPNQPDVAAACWTWAKVHFLSVLAFIIGVSVGVKVG